MPDPTTPARRLSAAELRTWRKRLLHGDWRLWDLEFFHVLVAAITVVTVLFATVLVVALTHRDGTVRVSVLFVAAVVGCLVMLRGAARAGLASTERRTAASAAFEARSVYLEALGRGATVRAGAASTFVTSSADHVGEYVARAVPAKLVALFVPVGVLIVVAIIDPWSALIAACVLAAVPLVMIRLGARARDEAEVGLGRLRSLSTRALELLEGAVELRALGAQSRGRDELAAATDRTVDSTRRSLRLGLRSATALDLLAGLAVGLVAMADGLRLLGGSLTLGHGLAAVLLVVEVFAPIRAAGAAFHAGADGRAALDALNAVDQAGRTPDKSALSPLPTVAAAPSAVVAQDVALVAGADGPVVLEGLTFSVPAGGRLVLTGPSGVGKTTVLRGIAGLTSVARGSLMVGNSSPGALSPRQRSAVLCVVDQRPFLVAGTLLENLVLGSNDVASDAVDDAVRRCGLDQLVSAARDGLDSQVGEDGQLLSAGERTRVALARAVLRAPGVLLLDEIGSHLDDASLEALRRELAPFLSSRTVIEAAHQRTLLTDAPTLELATLARST